MLTLLLTARGAAHLLYERHRKFCTRSTKTTYVSVSLCTGVQKTSFVKKHVRLAVGLFFFFF